MTKPVLPLDRASLEQEQFSRYCRARMRWRVSRPRCFRARFRRSSRKLANALGCALADDIVAPIDVPPFDRSNVDGFRGALGRSHRGRRGRSGAPCAQWRDHRLRHGAGASSRLGDGHRDRHRRPRCRAAPMPSSWSSTPSRWGAMRSRSAAPSLRGSSCPMPARTLRAARRCCAPAPSSARARSACWRPAASRRSMSCASRRVAVISTGDELAQPGQPLAPRRDLRHKWRDRRCSRRRERRRGDLPWRHSRRRSKT